MELVFEVIPHPAPPTPTLHTQPRYHLNAVCVPLASTSKGELPLKGEFIFADSLHSMRLYLPSPTSIRCAVFE